MSQKVYIYGLKCPLENKIRYVGKSQDPKTRLYYHIYNAKQEKPDNLHLSRWINKLILRNLSPILEILEECDIQIWKDKEKFWIKSLKGNDLCNKNEGGIEPPKMTGYKWTEEQMLRHSSIKRRGKRQWTDKFHPALGKPSPTKGQKRDKEFCDLMSRVRLEKNGMRGKILPEKRKQQIKLRNSKKVNLINEKGEVLKSYLSATEAALDLNLHASGIGRVCNGKYKDIGGKKFQWS